MAFRLASSWKVFAFTFNLLFGLILSQIMCSFLNKHTYHAFAEVIQALTLWTLSYIMINVGYEFTVDTNSLTCYFWDYLIAMTAAGFPWLFVAMWFLLTLNSIKVDEAFLIARFAAPTSAGILFSMLDAAGLRETWVFQKARILAIFDDLDTIILMIPLKIIMIGFKLELLVVIVIMAALLGLMLWKLHAFKLPFSWQWTLLYAAIASAVCKLLHYITHHRVDDMDPIHIEVLLPAFVIGCIIDTPAAREEMAAQRQSLEKKISNVTSASFDNTCCKMIQIVPAGDAKQCESTRNSQRSEASTAADSTDMCNEIESVEDIESIPQPNQMPAVLVACEAGSNAYGQKAPVSTPSSMIACADIGLQTNIEQKPLSYDCSEDIEVPHMHHVTNRDAHHGGGDWDHRMQTIVSMIFMVLVGLSMPPMFGVNAKERDSSMDSGTILSHVAMVTFLMIIGKMFPIMCYRDEASLSARLALCLGMCPRGEVGASIIVISLDLGITGPAIIISMSALVINLFLSGGFIGSVKMLLSSLDLDRDGVIDHDEWVLGQKEHLSAAKERSFTVSWYVRSGGAMLAFCAGMVNAVAFHTLNSFVSHLTGTFTKVGLGLEDSNVFSPGDTVLLLLCFVVGSTVCGCVIGKGTIHFGLALYDFGLIIEAVLLVLATVFSDERKLASYFASAACGLQNGLATTWGGAVIRTTHVTGLFTDVGLLIGRMFTTLLRKRCGSGYSADDKVEAEDDLSKLSVLLTIAAAFLVGAFVGAHLYNAMEENAFLVPAGITGAVGIVYLIYRVFVLRQKLFSMAEISRRRSKLVIL